MENKFFAGMNKNIWKKNPLEMVSLTAFSALVIMLFALTALLFTNLTGAIDNLMIKAGTPDYLQMHSGLLDMEKVENFSNSAEGVEEYQVVGFLNLDNKTMELSGNSLKDSTQDNGVCIQSDKFDFLIDMDDVIVYPMPGEVYVPACYEKLYDVKVGDYLSVGDCTLLVKGFVRDSQMNSMMASSKRFLVNEYDYDRLKEQGIEEYLIEYLVDDETDLNVFQAEYESADMPHNGPTITRSLVKMMNALSDGIMIMIILLVSIMVFIIAVICVRFILLTRIESDKKEIGVLKALGLSDKNIRGIYFRRFAVTVLLGAILGFVIAFVMFEPMAGQMHRLYGSSENTWKPLGISLVGTVLIVGIMLLTVQMMIRETNKMTAVAALNGSEATGNVRGSQKRQGYAYIFGIVAICVALMAIPSNLSSTLSSPDFVTYMGIGSADARIDIRDSESIEEANEELQMLLDQDSRVNCYSIYQTMSIPATDKSGSRCNLTVEYGEQSYFPVSYSDGWAPEGAGEIALSSLLAEELSLSVSDEIELESGKCKVCGIYSDITNGGKTAKMSLSDMPQDGKVMWSIVYLRLEDGVDIAAWVKEYKDAGVDAVGIADYVLATYGQTISQISMAAMLSRVVAVILIVLVVSLLMRLVIEKNRHTISVKKALGISSWSCLAEYMKNGISNVIPGVLLGILLANVAGESLCGMALSSLGADRFRLITNSWQVYLVIPVIAVLSTLVAMLLGAGAVKHISAVECCRGGER